MQSVYSVYFSINVQPIRKYCDNNFPHHRRTIFLSLINDTVPNYPSYLQYVGPWHNSRVMKNIIINGLKLVQADDC